VYLSNVFVESWRHGICIVQMLAGDRRQAMPSMCPKSYNALHGFTYCANNSFTYAARPLLSGNISTVVSGKSKIVSGKIKDGLHGKSLAAIPASIILLPRYKIQAYIIRHGGWCAGNECFS
jgi:hypothetical protein